MLTEERGLWFPNEREGQDLDDGGRVNEHDGRQVRVQPEVDFQVIDVLPQLGAFKLTWTEKPKGIQLKALLTLKWPPSYCLGRSD